MKKAPDKATSIEIEFKKGDPIALNGKKLSPSSLLKVKYNWWNKTLLEELI